MKRSKTDVFHWSPDTKRVQSLNGGRFIRVGDHLGKWHHLSVGRDADDLQDLLVTIGKADDALAAKIVKELHQLDADTFAWCVDLHAQGYDQ